MMPLEELVMMPLENTYISFLQKNTCERVLSRRLYYYHLPGWIFVQTTLLLSPTRLFDPLSTLTVDIKSIGPKTPKRRSGHYPPHVGSWVEKHWAQKTDRWDSPDIDVDNRTHWHIGFIQRILHSPAFFVLGTWAVVLMFRDYSRALGLVGLSRLRLVRLPFGMAVHVRLNVYIDNYKPPQRFCPTQMCADRQLDFEDFGWRSIYDIDPYEYCNAYENVPASMLSTSSWTVRKRPDFTNADSILEFSTCSEWS